MSSSEESIVAEVQAGDSRKHLSEKQSVRVFFNDFANLPHEVGVYEYSPTIDCHGMEWMVSIYPGGYEEAYAGNVSLFLTLMGEDRNVKARFTLRIPAASESRTSVEDFKDTARNGGRGWGSFCTREEALNSLNEDGALVVHADIQIYTNAPVTASNANQEIVARTARTIPLFEIRDSFPGKWISVAEAKERALGKEEWWKTKGFGGRVVELKQHDPNGPRDKPIWLWERGSMYLGPWKVPKGDDDPVMNEFFTHVPNPGMHGFGIYAGPFCYTDEVEIGNRKDGSRDLVGPGKSFWLESSPIWTRNELPDSPIKEKVDGKSIGRPFVYEGKYNVYGRRNDPAAKVTLKDGTCRIGPWKWGEPVGNWWSDKHHRPVAMATYLENEVAALEEKVATLSARIRTLEEQNSQQTKDAQERLTALRAEVDRLVQALRQVEREAPEESEDEDISGYLTPDEDMDEEPLATQPAPPEQVPDSPIAPTQDNDADGDDEHAENESENEKLSRPSTTPRADKKRSAEDVGSTRSAARRKRRVRDERTRTAKQKREYWHSYLEADEFVRH